MQRHLAVAAALLCVLSCGRVDIEPCETFVVPHCYDPCRCTYECMKPDGGALIVGTWSQACKTTP